MLFLAPVSYYHHHHHYYYYYYCCHYYHHYLGGFVSWNIVTGNLESFVGYENTFARGNTLRYLYKLGIKVFRDGW